MALPRTEWVWMNGHLVRWDDARIHVLAHVVHYGSSVFEGIRCYRTAEGPAIFRLREHVHRLFDSCRIYRMSLAWTPAEVEDAIREVVAANGLETCYIRPVVYRGYSELGLDPRGCPVELAIAAWPWGKYLGADSDRTGVDIKVSSWRRLAPDTLPAMAKAGANYMNSQLIKLEALADGYAEAVGLDHEGFVSEGSAENLFLIRDGVIYTPSWDSSVLLGITRDTVMALAGDLGLGVVERRIPREMLYVADEIFLSGTAAEITPVRSVDQLRIGYSVPGPITAEIERAYADCVHGEVEDRRGWLDRLPPVRPAIRAPGIPEPAVQTAAIKMAEAPPVAAPVTGS